MLIAEEALHSGDEILNVCVKNAGFAVADHPYLRCGKSYKRDSNRHRFDDGDPEAALHLSAKAAAVKARLLPFSGLHSPLPGATLEVDGHTPVEMANVHSSVTFFPQDPEIFGNTVLYNITLGLPFSKDEVTKVCAQAQFLDVLEKLPEGLDTYIQEKGVNLSGGQKHRLALARGILASRNSDIILMDEPSSSVDPRTEKLIYAGLFEALQSKTVISSLHRLHLLTHFDYIYILCNGQVVDEGTFERLDRYSLVFQEMWAHQQLDAGQKASPSPQMQVVC